MPSRRKIFFRGLIVPAGLAAIAVPIFYWGSRTDSLAVLIGKIRPNLFIQNESGKPIKTFTISSSNFRIALEELEPGEKRERYQWGMKLTRPWMYEVIFDDGATVQSSSGIITDSSTGRIAITVDPDGTARMHASIR